MPPVPSSPPTLSTPPVALRTAQTFDFVVSCIAFHSTGELVAVTAGKRTFLWQWQGSTQRQLQGAAGDASGEAPGVRDAAAEETKVVLMDGANPQRCVAFKVRAATCLWPAPPHAPTS